MTENPVTSVKTPDASDCRRCGACCIAEGGRAEGTAQSSGWGADCTVVDVVTTLARGPRKADSCHTRAPPHAGDVPAGSFGHRLDAPRYHPARPYPRRKLGGEGGGGISGYPVSQRHHPVYLQCRVTNYPGNLSNSLPLVLARHVACL